MAVPKMETYKESADFLVAQIPEALQSPKLAIICGSGLGGLAESVSSDVKVELDYASIPHFPQSTGKSFLLQSFQPIC